ncbi:hypothetical protein A3A39_04650 [Candidatus Kaiserbacteria bacterium RIFCSPLOWO2_01_FULL_54_13]|uniref:Uncharacterized protein n=1 Tax=Candidatus Kaiserbacteria bacterium RIFCSPLOWO2_01_FULL_54_13 TaxID=1798512 RepID=A0A1F6F1P2_9BACT|nr:MAG: hypothetical protein A3A39_04650 [Candidatus Kaiserbacteria bacterium RIFCSPLOWO2_01_FULL_54_13]
MDGADGSFTGAFPGTFWLFGELIFRWVPATVIAILNTSPSSPFANLQEPVAAWNVPALLAQASGQAGYEVLIKGWFVFALISIAISIPFLAVVLYCWIRIFQIRRREELAFRAAQRTVAEVDIPRTQLRWNRIEEQAGSSNPESWRLAILEADIMLSELLDLQGYKGETIADKMKQVDRAQFNSIDAAWDAHKVRNRVAHEGDIIDLTPREVRRVIGLYNRVFKEFRYIE